MALFSLPTKKMYGKFELDKVSPDLQKLYDSKVKEMELDNEMWFTHFPYIVANGEIKNKRQTLYRVEPETGLLWLLNHDIKKDEITAWHIPIGGGDIKTVYDSMQRMFEYMKEYNGDEADLQIKYMTRDAVNKLEEFDPDFREKFRVLKEGSDDYVYDSKALLTLEGKDFSYIRRKINKFKKLDYRVEEITDNHLESDLIDLYYEWKATSGEKYFRVVDATSYKYMNKNFTKFDKYIVLAVYVDNRLVGMISGGQAENGYGWCYFRKPMNNVEGLSEFLIIELNKRLHDKYGIDYLNDGNAGSSSDKGLHFFKERFRPARLIELVHVHDKKPKKSK